MSYKLFSGKDPYGKMNSIQNDKPIYQDFLQQQQILKDNFGKSGTNSNFETLTHQQKTGFEKYKPSSYLPDENKKNIFERKLMHH